MSAGALLAGAATPRRFYLLCLALALLAQFATEALFPLTRQHAESVDDHLIYISKSVQLFECPLQDCMAYRDVAAQTLPPTPDRELAFARYRGYQGSFLVYHPLYSVLLEALHALGLSYAQAFMWLGVAGSLAIVLGIGALLCQTVGAAAAGFGLLLVAPLVFQLRGMPVPSPVAVGLCMLLWARIIERRAASAATVLVAAPLLLAFHFVALPLLPVTAALYGALAFREDRRKALWVAGALCALTAAHILAQNLVAAPLLRPHAVVYPEGMRYASLVAENLRNAGGRVLDWGGQHMSVFAALLLAAYGALRLESGRRFPAAVLAAGLAALLAAGLLYPQPNHPGEMFRRFWLPAAVLLTGLLAKGLLEAAQELYRLSRAPESAAARRVLLGGIALFFALWMAADYARNWYQYALQTRTRLLRMDPPFSAAQAQALRALAPPGETILAMQWEVLFHLYNERFLDRHFVYYPALRGESETEWLQRRNPVKAGLAWHPFRHYDDALHDGLSLDRRSRLTIGHEPGRPIGALQLRAHSASGAELRVRVRYGDGGEGVLAPLRLAKGEARWLPLAGEAGREIAQFEIETLAGARFLFQGLRRDAASPRLWPWDEGLWVARGPRGESAGRRIAFRSGELYPPACPGAEIVDDSGYLVLARLHCRDGARAPEARR